jgi:transposase
MGQQRRKYTDDYKAGAVERLYEPGATQGSVAKELGITGTQLKTWRLEIEAFGSVEAKRRQQADAAELVRLRKDNKRLAEEVEILHKASTFFATRAVKPSLSGHCLAMTCRATDEQARFRHCP